MITFYDANYSNESVRSLGRRIDVDPLRIIATEEGSDGMTTVVLVEGLDVAVVVRLGRAGASTHSQVVQAIQEAKEKARRPTVTVHSGAPNALESARIRAMDVTGG